MVKKDDFDAPNSYHLGLIKNDGRSKIRAFVPNNGQNKKQNND